MVSGTSDTPSPTSIATDSRPRALSAAIGMLIRTALWPRSAVIRKPSVRAIDSVRPSAAVATIVTPSPPIA